MSYYISDKCIGCGLCAKNCPVEAIIGEKKQRHHIKEDVCIECGVCGRVCPVSAVLDERRENCDKVKRSQWKKPVLNYELCFGCSACKEMCIENCIEMNEGKPVLTDEEGCISCGACESVCGISAIVIQ